MATFFHHSRILSRQHLLPGGTVTLLIGNLGATDLTMSKSAYRGHRFPPEIIQLMVWMYTRFTLSLRDIEELLAERGLAASLPHRQTHR